MLSSCFNHSLQHVPLFSFEFQSFLHYYTCTVGNSLWYMLHGCAITKNTEVMTLLLVWMTIRIKFLSNYICIQMNNHMACSYSHQICDQISEINHFVTFDILNISRSNKALHSINQYCSEHRISLCHE